MPSNWRPVTPMERAQWAKWVKFYEGLVTGSVVRSHLAATIAGETQNFLDSHGFQLPTGPIITKTEADETRELLRIYNTVGRVLTGVHSGKYGMKLFQGDIDVLAPPDMPPEEWKGDQLGVLPIVIYAVIIGATLVGGLWAGSDLMKAKADLEYTKYKTKILEADKAMMAKPPDVRRDWMQRRKDFAKMEEKTKEETGILTNIFGSKGGAWITAAGIALLALVAMRFVPRAK